MPVHTSGTHRGHACAIVGSYAAGAAGRGVYHVGLLAWEQDVELGKKSGATVHDMGFTLGTNPMDPHLLGTPAELPQEAILKMEQWALNVLASQHEVTIEYYVIPPARMARSDIPGGPPTYRSFTCAGFVDQCYRDAARLPLVADESLPEIDLPTLLDVWKHLASTLRDTKKREKRGLVGNGPWPVLMPAYLFHAIRHFDDKGAEAGPYQPVVGDWYFPQVTTGT